MSNARGAADASGTCVDVLQPSQHLVQEKLVVLWRQVVIGFDDLAIKYRHSMSDC